MPSLILACSLQLIFQCNVLGYQIDLKIAAGQTGMTDPMWCHQKVDIKVSLVSKVIDISAL